MLKSMKSGSKIASVIAKTLVSVKLQTESKTKFSKVVTTSTILYSNRTYPDICASQALKRYQ